MEIYPLRYTGHSLQKQPSRNPKDELFPNTARPELKAEHFSDLIEQATIRASALTHRELREVAQSSFEKGLIDMDTYQQLSAELPMETVDARGRVLDLSTVTEDTVFDFAEYYQNQMAIAQTLGDDDAYQSLKSALAFLEGQ